MGVVVPSVTGWGGARPFDEAFADVVKEATSGVVQLAIGARPVENPLAIMKRHNVEVIAHHTIPLGENRVLRPGKDPSNLVEVLTRAGIRRYSAHPPPRNQANDSELLQWAKTWHDALASAGIAFALETMYPTKCESEAPEGWHLDNPSSVHRFLDGAAKMNWERPLVVDGAHLHIGMTSKTWTGRDVAELVERCVQDALCAEAHVSSNDGVRDRHEPPGKHPDVDEFVWNVAKSIEPLYIVDEGRRL